MWLILEISAALGEYEVRFGESSCELNTLCAHYTCSSFSSETSSICQPCVGYGARHYNSFNFPPAHFSTKGTKATDLFNLL